MKEYLRNVDATAVRIIVQDTLSFQQQMAIVGSVVDWVKKARVCLIEAIAYTTLAMTNKKLVHPIYWASLEYYFGIPLKKPKDDYYNESINKIRNALIITSNGLNQDLTISDIHEMGGLYGVLYRAGKSESDLKKEMGVVHQDLGEEIGKKVMSWIGLPPTRDVGPETRESHIYLNFTELMAKQKQSWWGTVTLIHEATHKYARTIDAQYFKAADDDLWKMYDAAVQTEKAMRKLIDSDDMYTGLMAQARKVISLRLGTEELENIRNMSRSDALNNADGLARYAHSVVNFPSWH